MKLLEDFLTQLNIPYDKTIIEKFELYYDLLIEYNKMFNLTNITEKNEVIVKHFAESIF